MQIYCGIDFGTTNTVVTITGKNGNVIDSFTTPTILFISREQHNISKVYIGADALEEFEEGHNGRYLHSIKRSLHDKHLKHTIINNQHVTLAELVRYFLEELNKKITSKWGIIPHNIVLGRPVIFSPNKEEDELAESRLLEGFRMAGYKDITLLEEPVAAALCFESHLDDEDEHFLIVDLGGGTSDFTVVRRDSAKEGIDRYDILGIHGINMGGDNFDEDLMFAKVSNPLGINATFSSKSLPMPVHLYRSISKWNTIHSPSKKKIDEEFRDLQYQSSDREAVLKLKKVMEQNLSRKILHKVRDSKHDLSSQAETSIVFDEQNLDIKENVTQTDFENIIDSRTRNITGNITEILDRAGMKPEQMDKVILTGGSSQITYIQKVIKEIFNEDQIIIDNNLHNSVSKGLSSYAYYKGIKIS
ncbi:MAG: Hsp70 family protein [Spirochaetales bacterium]|uniref:Hsp70 family protein n=1 Tax=Candidatus Thalassospirochaeta sargassi TaxID=3119039 RepID=A0AAJ1IE88_9SPIO|nr:Hsp70 family protein [Spirochaetales bacterium]